MTQIWSWNFFTGHEITIWSWNVFLSVMNFFGHETSFSSVMNLTPWVMNFTTHVMNQQITFWSWNDHSGHEIFHLHESHSGHVNHILVLFVCLFVCLGKTRKSILRSLCLEVMKISRSWITFWSWKIHRLNHILVVKYFMYKKFRISLKGKVRTHNLPLKRNKY